MGNLLVHFQKKICKRANFLGLTHFFVVFMTLLFLYFSRFYYKSWMGWRIKSGKLNFQWLLSHQSSSNITEKLAVSNLQKIWVVASLDDQMGYFADQISKISGVFISMPNFGILPKFSRKTSHMK